MNINMKVLIIEDEQLAADKLKRQLLQVAEEIQVIEVVESVKGAVEWLSNNTVDLILSDIHLSDGLSFNIFNQIQVKTPVIFVTAYDQYAIQAFKVNSIDYLLKPVAKTDLMKAIDKFNELQSGLNEGIDFTAVIDAMNGPVKEYQKRFMVYFGDKIRTVSVEDVAYFYAEGKYVFLVCTDGQEYIVDFTLDKLSHVLDPAVFFRINRQFIVGLKGIETMYSYTKGRVKIDLNPPAKKEAVVSVDRAGSFKKWLNQ